MEYILRFVQILRSRCIREEPPERRLQAELPAHSSCSEHWIRACIIAKVRVIRD
jgi:hypothetical protein